MALADIQSTAILRWLNLPRFWKDRQLFNSLSVHGGNKKNPSVPLQVID